MPPKQHTSPGTPTLLRNQSSAFSPRGSEPFFAPGVSLGQGPVPTGEEAIPLNRGGRKEQGVPGAARAAETVTRPHEAGGTGTPAPPPQP